MIALIASFSIVAGFVPQGETFTGWLNAQPPKQFRFQGQMKYQACYLDFSNAKVYMHDRPIQPKAISGLYEVQVTFIGQPKWLGMDVPKNKVKVLRIKRKLKPKQ